MKTSPANYDIRHFRIKVLDFSNSQRVLKVESMNSVISTLDHARKLNSSNIYLTSINKLFMIIVTLE